MNQTSLSKKLSTSNAITNLRGATVPNCREKIWSRERIIADVQAKYEELGKTPRLADFAGSGITQAIYKEFGNWNNMLKELGVKPNRKTPVAIAKKKASQKELRKRSIAAVKELAGILGARPTISQYDTYRAQLNKTSWPSRSLITKLFGTWKNCLDCAGLKVPYEREVDAVRRISEEYKDQRCINITNLPASARNNERILKLLKNEGFILIRCRPHAGMDARVIKAVDKGLPEMPKHERGRSLALQWLFEDQTFEAIGHAEGLTRERVRQLVTNYITAVSDQ